MEEQHWKDALELWAKHIFYALCGYSSLKEYYSGCTDRDRWLSDYWKNGREGKLFNYGGPYTLDANIVKRVNLCQDKLRLKHHEVREIFANTIEDLKLPIHLFTKDECIKIYFWERDGLTEHLAKLYQEAKDRL